MVTHSHRVDLLYKDYLFWTWYQVTDKTLAFCPDTIITLILIGKKLSALFEDDLNSVSYRYFTCTMPFYRNQAKLLVPICLYSNTYLYIIREDSHLWFGCTLQAAVHPLVYIQIPGFKYLPFHNKKTLSYLNCWYFYRQWYTGSKITGPPKLRIQQKLKSAKSKWPVPQCTRL